jgi:hypothetical protein
MELQNTSTSSPEGNWLVTSQIVRRLFADLATQRNPGGDVATSADKFNRGATYLWLTLQAVRVMRQYQAANFREHASIAPMLNIHLFKMMVPIERVKALELQLKEAKVLAEKAMTAANAAKGHNLKKQDKA